MPLSPLLDPPRFENDDNTAIQLSEADAIAGLSSGKMRERGLLPYSSNHSFLVTVTVEEVTEGQPRPPRESAPSSQFGKIGRLVLPAVYKPQRGESPLWDFEWGSLCRRETAAYEISRGLGWRLVPPTVLRDGTRGVGSVQLYIDHDDDEHYFTVQADARYASSFRRMALFDYVINNADRKSGHCLIGERGQVWAIDHGVCLHSEYKLRTVIWEFSDDLISDDLMNDLVRYREQLGDGSSTEYQSLCKLLSPSEQKALRRRVDDLVRMRRYPAPDPYRRNFPWPPI